MAEKNFSTADLEMLRKIGVGEELATAFQWRRVNDKQARDLLALNEKSGNMAGLYIPYFDPRTGYRVSGRVRRDHPEIQDGKPKGKYVNAWGDRRHLFFPLDCGELLNDFGVTPAVLVEAEKSVLAIWALCQRTGRRLLPIGLGGVWSFMGKIGKGQNAAGVTVDEKGVLEDLRVCHGRVVFIIFDSDTRTNPSNKAARRALVRALYELKAAQVRVVDLKPEDESKVGPDDLIGLRGDKHFLSLLDDAMLVDKNGSAGGQLAAAVAMLRESSEWQGVLSFNEFTLHTTTKKPAPWQETGGADWTDFDDLKICEWLQRHNFSVNASVASQAVQVVAKDDSFHPVREFLAGLTWDQKPRLDTWLSTYLGVEDTPFVRAVGLRWMISAVARIMRPGCQADYTLLLEGPQGIRKSTALEALAGAEWFTDHISDLGSKDSRIELHGKWIIEFSELAAVRRGELERVKGFLTARIDHFRMPYGRRSEAVPRSCVFAGSVNEETPFTDSTGNRRFWPVRCGKIDVDALRADRNQLWAEAFSRYRSGEPWWLHTSELNDAASVEQAERFEPGVWDERILAWLENPTQAFDKGPGTAIPLEPFDSDRTRVTIADILLHAIGKPLDRQTQGDRRQVQRCLVHHGWKRRQDRTSSLRGKWFYYRPDGQLNGTSS